jgi:hypothetical protein
MQGSLQRLLCLHATIMVFCAFFAGLMIGAVGVGQLAGSLDDWKLAHMEGLINGILLFAIAGCMHWLALSEGKAKVVTVCLIVMGYCNTNFGLMRGMTGALGYQFEGALANDITAAAGMLGVPLGFIAFTLIFIGAFGATKVKTRQTDRC